MNAPIDFSPIAYRYAGQEMPDQKMYTYVTGGNGVFIHAKRRNLEAIVPVALADIRGLALIEPKVNLLGIEAKISSKALKIFVSHANKRCPSELLGYISWNSERVNWVLNIPSQYSTPFNVSPINPDDPCIVSALCEIHSHGTARAYFSQTDDEEEQQGFRICTVIGKVTSTSFEIITRIAIYGYFYIIPSDLVWDFPAGIDVQDRYGDCQDD